MGAPKFFSATMFIQPVSGGPVDEVHAIGFDQTEWELALSKNRDWPRPDLSKPNDNNGKFWMMTFLAWHAAVREKVVQDVTFDEFRRTYQITTADEVDEVDPTSRDPGAI